MKFTVLIPIRLNDGREQTPAELAQIVGNLWIPFGGVTNEGLVQGSWVDPKDGTRYDDQNLRVSIVFQSLDELFKALSSVREIGRQMEQKAMYVELLGCDGPYFLRTDD